MTVNSYMRMFMCVEDEAMAIGDFATVLAQLENIACRWAYRSVYVHMCVECMHDTFILAFMRIFPMRC
jgi:hypothetical protein